MAAVRSIEIALLRAILRGAMSRENAEVVKAMYEAFAQGAPKP
jgi:hypothetical protein